MSLSHYTDVPDVLKMQQLSTGLKLTSNRAGSYQENLNTSKRAGGQHVRMPIATDILEQ